MLVVRQAICRMIAQKKVFSQEEKHVLLVLLPATTAVNKVTHQEIVRNLDRTTREVAEPLLAITVEERAICQENVLRRETLKAEAEEEEEAEVEGHEVGVEVGVAEVGEVV
jgi:hypothetical protein